MPASRRTGRPSHEQQEWVRARALAHPLRLRLLEAFAAGRHTTLQVAHSLGLPPTRLYHHVYALERAGLIRLAETRPNRGTVEKYFELVPPSIDAPRRRGAPGPAQLRTRRQLAALVLDEARLDVAQSIGEQETPALAPVMVARLLLHGTPREVDQLRRRMFALLKQYAPRRRARTGASEDAPSWAITIALAPRRSAKQEGR